MDHHIDTLDIELKNRDWKAPDYDAHLFYQVNLMCLVCVDDCIFLGNDRKELDNDIADLRASKPIPFELEE